MIYWIKRKYKQISTIIWWIPKIWNNFDFDYSYSTKMLVYQLERQADFLESDKACTVSAKDKASKIRKFIRLYYKVYNEDYACEYQNILKKEYGNLFDLIIPEKEKFLKYRYETLGFNQEYVSKLKNIFNKEYEKSKNKQIKAHRILWLYFEHNVQSWWD